MQSLTLGGITAHMSEHRRRVSGSCRTFRLVDRLMFHLVQIKSIIMKIVY